MPAYNDDDWQNREYTEESHPLTVEEIEALDNYISADDFWDNPEDAIEEEYPELKDF